MNQKNLSWLLGFAAGTAISLIINNNIKKRKAILSYSRAGYLPVTKLQLYDDPGVYYV